MELVKDFEMRFSWIIQAGLKSNDKSEVERDLRGRGNVTMEAEIRVTWP